jgi:LPXTG-motif cell wall-anchored protein
MSWLSFLILGIIAGVIAKLILRTKVGWFLTIILGVVGAMVGGWIAGLIPGVGYANFWSIQSWLIAIAGALIVLVIFGLITRRRKKA